MTVPRQRKEEGTYQKLNYTLEEAESKWPNIPWSGFLKNLARYAESNVEEAYFEKHPFGRFPSDKFPGDYFYKLNKFLSEQGTYRD